MIQPLARPATYDDLCQVPDRFLAQIVHGQLHVHPRPAPKHALAASIVGGKLVPKFHDDDGGGPGGWWILFEPELHLGMDILVPDFAGWRRERMPALPDTAYFDLAPDWVCEVLSPSTARLDRVEKLALYAIHGVAHAWLIDPDAKTLEVFALVDSKWRLETALAEDAEVCAVPFDAIAFSLASLWT